MGEEREIFLAYPFYLPLLLPLCKLNSGTPEVAQVKEGCGHHIYLCTFENQSELLLELNNTLYLRKCCQVEPQLDLLFLFNHGLQETASSILFETSPITFAVSVPSTTTLLVFISYISVYKKPYKYYLPNIVLLHLQVL